MLNHFFSNFHCISGAGPTSKEAAKILNGTGRNVSSVSTDDDSTSSLEGDIDMLDDIEEEKEIYRTKVNMGCTWYFHELCAIDVLVLITTVHTYSM